MRDGPDPFLGGDFARERAIPPPRQLPDLSPLLALIDALRRLIPPDLQEQFAALQRELLLTLRALIDWYLERLERRRTEPAEVQDIPIL